MALTLRLSEPQALAVGPSFERILSPFSSKLALSVHKVSAIGREPSGFSAPDALRPSAKTATYLRTLP